MADSPELTSTAQANPEELNLAIAGLKDVRFVG
jgi:hypothetical protein